MKAQDFFLIAFSFFFTAFLLAILNPFLLDILRPLSSLGEENVGEARTVIIVAFFVMLFLAIGCLIAGVIKKLISKSSPRASLLLWEKSANHV